jgi:hypothetical protein
MNERILRTAKATFTLKSVDRTTLTAPKVVLARQVRAEREWDFERGIVVAIRKCGGAMEERRSKIKLK